MGLLFRDIRPYQGRTVSSENAVQTITLATTYDFLDITGQGALRTCHFFVAAANDSHKMWPKIKIDGVYIHPSGQIQGLSQRGYDANTTPLSVNKMLADGTCNMYYVFIPELTFDKSLLIEVTNWSAANSIQVTANWLYYIM